jgi:CHAT domain-containing protein
MSTGQLSRFIGNKKAPVFCFVNGCETALNAAWEKSYNIFSLAQAFLSTGAYLLGSRWKLADSEAADFALAFYTALLQDKKSIGEATLLARKKLKESAPVNSFSWASYVLYADPRLCFKYA